jgi:hypothetical protein
MAFEQCLDLCQVALRGSGAKFISCILPVASGEQANTTQRDECDGCAAENNCDTEPNHQ